MLRPYGRISLAERPCSTWLLEACEMPEALGCSIESSDIGSDKVKRREEAGCLSVLEPGTRKVCYMKEYLNQGQPHARHFDRCHHHKRY